MRRALLAGWTVLVLAVLALAVHQKEGVLAGGEQVFLELVPVDPRSLIQGDYMRLRYAVAREARRQVGSDAPARGHLVVELDEDGVARFARLDDGTPLAERERLVRYRRVGSGFRVVPGSFFFQEGHAGRFEQARYAVFVYGSPREAVLAELADERREIIARR